MCNAFNDSGSLEFLDLIIILCWFIWKSRNAKIFAGKECNPAEIVSHASDLCFQLKNIPSPPRVVSRFLHSQGSQSAWNVPPPDFLKINMDASYCKLTQTATMAIIVRDSGGRLVVGFCFSRPSLSALAAETMALLAGVFIAKAR